MSPEEFEVAVAQDFESRGFATELTPASRDYGVDIVAKGLENIAIQAKMYDVREVNYKEIMYLYAGRALYECDRAVLVTSGAVREDAKIVAARLSVELIEHWTPTETGIAAATPLVSGQTITFDEAWRSHIFSLKGRVVRSATGKETMIVDVTWDWISRVRTSGKTCRIDINVFRECYARLLEQGRLSRETVNHIYPQRGSSFIIAVLRELPNVELQTKPTAALILRG